MKVKTRSNPGHYKFRSKGVKVRLSGQERALIPFARIYVHTYNSIIKRDKANSPSMLINYASQKQADPQCFYHIRQKVCSESGAETMQPYLSLFFVEMLSDLEDMIFTCRLQL